MVRNFGNRRPGASRAGWNCSANDQEDARSLEEVLIAAIEKCAMSFAEKIEEDAGKQAPSIGELIKLLPLLKDLRAERPLKGIEVRWIDAPRPDISN